MANIYLTLIIQSIFLILFIPKICKKHYKMNNINNNDNIHNNKYVNDFKRYNKSIISDAFTGFYQYNNLLNSQNNSFNSPNKELKSFSFIKFNLN